MNILISLILMLVLSHGPVTYALADEFDDVQFQREAADHERWLADFNMKKEKVLQDAHSQGLLPLEIEDRMRPLYEEARQRSELEGREFKYFRGFSHEPEHLIRRNRGVSHCVDRNQDGFFSINECFVSRPRHFRHHKDKWHSEDPRGIFTIPPGSGSIFNAAGSGGTMPIRHGSSIVVPAGRVVPVGTVVHPTGTVISTDSLGAQPHCAGFDCRPHQPRPGRVIPRHHSHPAFGPTEFIEPASQEISPILNSEFQGSQP